MRQFINSGMWLRPPQRPESEGDSKGDLPLCDEESDRSQNATGPYNTFVYVDSAGPLLFRWCDKELTAKEIALTDYS